MARTVTARFESEAEAEQALAHIAAEVPLRDSAVVGSGLAGTLTLDSLNLSPEERAACEQQVSKGGFLLVAQVVTESRAEAVLALLDGSRPPAPPEPAAAPPAPATGEAESDFRISPPQPAADPDFRITPPPPPPPEPTPVAEERIPLLEEELRIGKREVVRGRSQVHAFVAEVPVTEDVELLHEETHVERRPVNRRLSDEEVAQGGLLQQRVIEVAEMREEAVVTKEAFVREELVVTKSVHRRIEQVNETVRRTEVELERLPGDEAAPMPAGAASGDRPS